MPIKTLSLRETVFLLFQACDLPTTEHEINAHLRSLAKRRLRTTRQTTTYKENQVKDHLKQYV